MAKGTSSGRVHQRGPAAATDVAAADVRWRSICHTTLRSQARIRVASLTSPAASPAAVTLSEPPCSPPAPRSPRRPLLSAAARAALPAAQRSSRRTPSAARRITQTASPPRHPRCAPAWRTQRPARRLAAFRPPHATPSPPRTPLCQRCAPRCTAVLPYQVTLPRAALPPLPAAHCAPHAPAATHQHHRSLTRPDGRVSGPGVRGSGARCSAGARRVRRGGGAHAVRRRARVSGRAQRAGARVRGQVAAAAARSVSRSLHHLHQALRRRLRTQADRQGAQRRLPRRGSQGAARQDARCGGGLLRRGRQGRAARSRRCGRAARRWPHARRRVLARLCGARHRMRSPTHSFQI